MKKERQNDNSHSKTNIPNLGVQYLHTLTNKIIDFCTFHDTRVVQQRARWKKNWYWLTPFRDIDDQSFMQLDWIRDTPGNTQPQVVAFDATLKKTKISVDSFQRYRWSKNPAIWLDETCNWPNPTKKVVPNSIFPWCKKKSRILINSSLIYWYLKNTASWLVLRILGHNCRTRFTPDMMLPQNHKAYGCATFLG